MLRFRLIGKRPVSAALVIGDDRIVFLNLIFIHRDLQGDLHNGSSLGVTLNKLFRVMLLY